MSEMDDSVTLRAFANEIGKSHVWVLKLKKAGIIPSNEDGSIPHRAALEAYQAYLASRPPKTEKEEGKSKGSKSSPAMADIDEAVKTGMSYNKAKAADKVFSAQLKEMELRKRKGELVEKAEVELQIANLAERINSKLSSIPSRVAGMCEGRTAREIEDIIEVEIERAKAELRTDLMKN